MNSRERTARAVKRGHPDRAPFFYSLLPGAERRLGDHLCQLERQYPPDIARFGYDAGEEFSGRASEPTSDRWGAVWVSASDDVKGQVVEHPLADWSKMERYAWPAPTGWPEFDAAEAYIASDQGQHYVLADGDTLFQRMLYLRGVENLLLDLATGEPRLIKLRDQICDYMLQRVVRWTALGVDGVYFRDDWGSQEALLIRPARWRELFKPTYAALFAAVHEGGADVFFHSDGMIAAILPDLVEIGVDVLHPQMQLLGVDRLASSFGGRVSFVLDPDRQQILPRGAPEAVTRHVEFALDTLGRFGGGVIGWGEIGPDVPWANANALVRALATQRYEAQVLTAEGR